MGYLTDEVIKKAEKWDRLMEDDNIKAGYSFHIIQELEQENTKLKEELQGKYLEIELLKEEVKDRSLHIETLWNSEANLKENIKKSERIKDRWVAKAIIRQAEINKLKELLKEKQC